MAGVGKRMRPHTLSTPKPLLKVAGKSIVERIILELKRSTGKNIDEIHFVVGNFGKDIENTLKGIAESIGAKGFTYEQELPLGTAHAVYCAEEALKGELLIAFADTMFIGDFKIDESDEAIIWTKEVENPESYGVVKVDDLNRIEEFIEKPKEFVSDKAIIGIYYFSNAELLAKEIEELIRYNRMKGGEYQLTDALSGLLSNGMIFKCGVIKEWLDCGNKYEFLDSVRRIVQNENEHKIREESDVKFVGPVYIGRNVRIKDSIIGPNVAIEDNTEIIDSKINDSVVGTNCKISGSGIVGSLIGNYCELKGVNGILNIGDYNQYESI